MENQNNHNDQIPIYNIKAVSHLVGLLPVTLRAWERRYGMPRPKRGGQGYRLYSEHDVRVLRWLKAQNQSGLSIGRAVEYLNKLQSKGLDPTSDIGFQTIKSADYTLAASSSATSSASLESLYQEFINALVQFQEKQALDVLRRAFTIYTVDQVFAQVITTTLLTLGEAWRENRLPIVVEHYATQVCMQHLMSMLASAATPSRPGRIVAACAPGEHHQIGLIMLIILLRWQGWEVKYLGPDLILDRLEEALVPLRPTILMLSASRPETAARLTALPELMAHFPDPKPLVLLGGKAFQTERLPEAIQATYLEGSPSEVAEQVEALMVRITHSALTGFAD